MPPDLPQYQDYPYTPQEIIAAAAEAYARQLATTAPYRPNFADATQHPDNLLPGHAPRGPYKTRGPYRGHRRSYRGRGFARTPNRRYDTYTRATPIAVNDPVNYGLTGAISPLSSDDNSVNGGVHIAPLSKFRQESLEIYQPFNTHTDRIVTQVIEAPIEIDEIHNLQPSSAPLMQDIATSPTKATPDYVKPTPLKRFTPVYHKEKLAILAMESIPGILVEDSTFENVDRVTTALVSPTMPTITSKMKFHFARAMAQARLEADAGKDTVLMPEDVMKSIELECFLAGVVEVRDVSGRLVFRRYHRATDDRLQGKGVGAVVAMGHSHSVFPRGETLQSVMEEIGREGVIKGRLLAEVEVSENGTTKKIWWNDSTDPKAMRAWKERKLE